MSLYWLLFMTLTVAGGVAYNVGMKMGSANANPFGFIVLLTGATLVFQGICFLIAKYGFHIDVTEGLSPRIFKYAVVSGAAAASIDFTYFLALRYGSLISSQIFWTIGGMVALAAFALFFMGESMTWTKALGLAFGVVSILLITKAP